MTERTGFAAGPVPGGPWREDLEIAAHHIAHMGGEFAPTSRHGHRLRCPTCLNNEFSPQPSCSEKYEGLAGKSRVNLEARPATVLILIDQSEALRDP